jgi:hypothetical protein
LSEDSPSLTHEAQVSKKTLTDVLVTPGFCNSVRGNHAFPITGFTSSTTATFPLAGAPLAPA